MEGGLHLPPHLQALQRHEDVLATLQAAQKDLEKQFGHFAEVMQRHREALETARAESADVEARSVARIEEILQRVLVVEGRGDPISFDNLCKAAQDVRDRAQKEPAYRAYIEQHYPGGSMDPPMHIPWAYLLELGYIERGRATKRLQEEWKHKVERLEEELKRVQAEKKEAEGAIDFEVAKKEQVIQDMRKQLLGASQDAKQKKTEFDELTNTLKRLRNERDRLWDDKKALEEDLRSSKKDHMEDCKKRLRRINREVRSALRDTISPLPDALFSNLDKLFEQQDFGDK
jgi:chromosome segregation ATPase